MQASKTVTTGTGSSQEQEGKLEKEVMKIQLNA